MWMVVQNPWNSKNPLKGRSNQLEKTSGSNDLGLNSFCMVKTFGHLRSFGQKWSPLILHRYGLSLHETFLSSQKDAIYKGAAVATFLTSFI